MRLAFPASRPAPARARLHLLAVVALALTLLGPLAPEPARAAAPLYPDLRPTNPSSLYFAKVTIGGASHWVLRFSSTVWNVGEGRFEIQGDPNPSGGNAIYQNIYDHPTGGSRVARSQIATDILYHPTHYHYHVSNFASYRLLQRDASGTYQPTTKDGTKSSFCIIDYARLNASGPAYARYTACSGTLQGISVGWGDTYVASLPEQWVDLGTSPLPNGFYAVRSTVDPTNVFNEAGRDGNNTATTYFHVNNGIITIGTATSTAPTGMVGTVVNTGGTSLNCRSTPGGTIIARLPAGSTVQVRGAAQNGWYPVVCGGQNGWVSATYLRVTGSVGGTPTPTPPPSGVIGTVYNTNGASLICRATPGGTIIGYIPAGTSVQVRGALQGGWYPVVCNARNGWVSAAYLLVDDGTTTIPPSGLTATVINTNGSSLICRASPGGTIIGYLPAGTTVPVTGPTQNGWVPITCFNRAGWASAYYLRINVVATPTPTATATATVSPTGEPATVTPTGTTPASTMPPTSTMPPPATATATSPPPTATATLPPPSPTPEPPSPTPEPPTATATNPPPP